MSSGALDELTLTTNGSQLARYAAELSAHGVRRINVSLDTLDPEQVPGDHPLGRSRQGASAGSRRRRPAGLQVKINTVALKGVNEHEIPEPMLEWAMGAAWT